MKLKLILVTAILGAALALPSASSAQLPPTQDSVVLTGAPAWIGPLEFPSYRIDGLNATSGPSGENPTGHATVANADVGPVTTVP